MKTYAKPEIKTLQIDGENLLEELSGVDPNGSGGNIHGGSGNSSEHPLDAKDNNAGWDVWDDGEVWQ